MPFLSEVLSDGSVGSLRTEMLVFSGVPAVIFDEVRQFDDELTLLVLLARFEGVLVLPAEIGGAAFAKNIGHRMQAGEKDTVLSVSAVTVHDTVEQISSTGAALKDAK